MEFKRSRQRAGVGVRAGLPLLCESHKVSEEAGWWRYGDHRHHLGGDTCRLICDVLLLIYDPVEVRWLFYWVSLCRSVGKKC